MSWTGFDPEPIRTREIKLQPNGVPESREVEALERIATALERLADKYTNPAKFDGKWMTKAEAEAFRRSVGDQTT